MVSVRAGVRLVVTRGLRLLGWAGVALGLSYLVMLVAAVRPSPVAFLVAAVVSYAAERGLHRHRLLSTLLGRFLLPVSQRFLLREAFLVVLALRAEPDPRPLALPLLGAIVVLQIVRLAFWQSLRSAPALDGHPFAWRNLTVDGVPGSGSYRAGILGRHPMRTFVHADLPLVLGVPLVPALGLPAGVVPYLCGATVLLALLATGALELALPRLRTLPAEAEVLARLRAAVEAHAPEVVVYFSSPPGNTYPLNVWLRTFDRLRRPAVIYVREPYHLDALGETGLPVLVLPRAEDLVALRVPSLRAALYPTNVVRNNELLRISGIRSALILHGDSDKAASVSPTARAYDEIWVAGEGGRARFARTREGFRPDQVRVVGRPQLAEIGVVRPGPAPADGLLTVLYAPTWEGFYDASDYSSLRSMGPAMVEALAGLDRPVRLLYKPHPATGLRVRAYAAAGEAVTRVVTAAGNGGRVVDDGAGLYAAFDEADLLLTDVSSVATDFLHSGKPLLVTDPADRGDDAFVAAFPSTAAAYRVGPDPATLLAAVALATGDDPRQDERLRMRTYLLGTVDGVDPVERFAAEVDSLVARNRHAGPVAGLQRLAADLPAARGKR